MCFSLQLSALSLLVCCWNVFFAFACFIQIFIFFFLSFFLFSASFLSFLWIYTNLILLWDFAFPGICSLVVALVSAAVMMLLLLWVPSTFLPLHILGCLHLWCSLMASSIFFLSVSLYVSFQDGDPYSFCVWLNPLFYLFWLSFFSSGHLLHVMSCYFVVEVFLFPVGCSLFHMQILFLGYCLFFSKCRILIDWQSETGKATKRNIKGSETLKCYICMVSQLSDIYSEHWKFSFANV